MSAAHPGGRTSYLRPDGPTTALVTGGTSGIGLAFARALAGRGIGLVLVARDAARLERTAAELRAGHRVPVETVAADLADRTDLDLVAGRLTDDAAPVHVLVNNAGNGLHTPLTAEDTAGHEQALDLMCRAVLVLGAAAGRTMRERGSGAVINVSSVAGFITLGGYSAVKAWVAAYSESLATELAGTGVQVTTLVPGWVRTEFHQRARIRTSSIPEALWLDADELVAACLRDVDRGRVISVPSARYRVLLALARHAPRPAVRGVSARLSRSRR